METQLDIFFGLLRHCDNVDDLAYLFDLSNELLSERESIYFLFCAADMYPLWYSFLS